MQVELAYDWRSESPARFIDVHAALARGEYTEADLLRLAQHADAGFDQHTFGQALLGINHTQDADFVIYGVGLHDLVVLRNRLRSWGEVLAGDSDTETAARGNGRSVRR